MQELGESIYAREYYGRLDQNDDIADAEDHRVQEHAMLKDMAKCSLAEDVIRRAQALNYEFIMNDITMATCTEVATMAHYSILTCDCCTPRNMCVS